MTTIFALATGVARSAIAVLRISGPQCREILERLAGPCPEPRHASLRTLVGPLGEILDRGLILFFPGPQSYTGEDVAELHVHGGPAVVRSVSRALSLAGARPAEPGEFTRRAFLHGRMDLLEAEGIADLIAADTDIQRVRALEQVAGAQSSLLQGWADRLRRALAFQEALIDFSDENLPASVEQDMLADLAALAQALAQAAEAGKRGARVRDGIVVAVTGKPNVGKSTLVNRLAGRDVAITSPHPGTTRDTLEAWIDLHGYGVCLVDTAGLRDTQDEVEAEGVRRAVERAERADLVICVEDAASASRGSFPDGLQIANKVDQAPAPAGWLGVSAKTGEGMEALRQTLLAAVLELTATKGSPILGAARHEAALHEACACLKRAHDAPLAEIRGEEIRLAMQALGRITGAVGVEDVLDVVFGAFCIGK